MAKKYQDICREVSEKIAQQLEDGTANGNWQMPWQSLEWAHNAKTGKEYRGMNLLILQGAEWWATYKQWRSLGRSVKRGESARYISYWGPIQKKNPETGKYENVLNDKGKPIPVAKVFAVFAYEQTEALDDDAWTPPDKPNVAVKLDVCEKIVEKNDPRIKASDHASYVFALDYINMPTLNSFYSTEGYYATLFHEMGHWTGHESRLGREQCGMGGDKQVYAFEELIAELTAAFICVETGLTPEPRPDHAQYVQSWIKHLREDATAFPRAVSAATKARVFLMDGLDGEEGEEEEDGDDD